MYAKRPSIICQSCRRPRPQTLARTRGAPCLMMGMTATMPTPCMGHLLSTRCLAQLTSSLTASGWVPAAEELSSETVLSNPELYMYRSYLRR